MMFGPGIWVVVLPTAVVKEPKEIKDVPNPAAPAVLMKSLLEKCLLLSDMIVSFLNSEFFKKYPEGKASLLSYIELYLEPEKAEELKAVSDSYKISFIPYDWNLNDQNAQFMKNVSVFGNISKENLKDIFLAEQRFVF